MAKWALFTYQMTIFCELLTNDVFCVLQGHGVMWVDTASSQ